MTLISPAGQSGMKFSIVFNWGFEPRRAVNAPGWPANAEENRARLDNAGFPCTSLIPKCGNCGELGHIRNDCKQEKVESSYIAPVVKCIHCNEEGHRARDCPQDRVDPFACRNCKKSGHQTRECPEERSADNVECNHCREMGHFSRDCPTRPAREPFLCRNCGEEGHRAADCPQDPVPSVITCRNCGEEGHMSRECPKERDASSIQCRNCDAFGHFSKDCPKKRDYSRVQCKNCGQCELSIFLRILSRANILQSATRLSSVKSRSTSPNLLELALTVTLLLVPLLLVAGRLATPLKLVPLLLAAGANLRLAESPFKVTGKPNIS